MGPKDRYLGSEVPDVVLPWQDPIPSVDHELVGASDIESLKRQVLDSGLSVADLVSVAWASASTYRDSDKRGGANGARVRLAPQKDWAVNDPERLVKTLQALEGVQAAFDDAQSDSRRISMADLTVLGGCAALEKAAADAGIETTVPFVPGRMDTSDELTDAESLVLLRHNFRTSSAARPQQGQHGRLATIVRAIS